MARYSEYTQGFEDGTPNSIARYQAESIDLINKHKQEKG